jgi:hypothetical protein
MYLSVTQYVFYQKHGDHKLLGLRLKFVPPCSILLQFFSALRVTCTRAPEDLSGNR